ncbi:uncharacterized protein LOC116011981 [Ipomoea triloba]|uniref:uncharacterized protein LOC116011981 n=1 Tax=Ipomoea triloba TaxID=35885 RepID=UPI00125DC5BA|nr:uncharacterized protein LOC116011981 [Ipomoea triloba]
MTEEEKVGRVPHPEWLRKGFCEAVRGSGLSDFAFHGCQFTWERGRGTGNWVREKLDRVLVSGSWRDMFPGARAWSVEGGCSDHMPIHLVTQKACRTSYVRRPRYENAWGKLPECKGIVERVWHQFSSLSIGDKLGLCGKEIWGWGRGRNKGELGELNWCRNRLIVLRRRSDDAGAREFILVQKRYLSLVQSQSDRWRQRAKELWYEGGDSNTRFFHSSVNGRRRRNRINALRNSNGTLVSDEEGKANIMVDYFQNLFHTEERDDWPVLACVRNRVSSCQNDILLRKITEEEVKAAVFAMHPDKSPGPDGLSPAFFQTHWAIVGGEKKQPDSMTDFRPISLCNVVYRILAKVLANRLREVLQSVISSAQSAFIPGRSIVDNVLIAFESVHSMYRMKRGIGGYGDLKVDMTKAYDRVELGFLGRVMLQMGFSERWVHLMTECVSTVRYNVLVEKSLSEMLWVSEEDGGLHGVSVAREAPTISHLFFADDCLFFFRANNLEVGCVKEILREYGSASGQKINMGKSAITFGNNVDREDKEAVCAILGVHEQHTRGSYLGLPGYVGRRKREILGFVREKVRGRILHWGNRFLSRGGREVLLKTVLQSIPNYAMNVFLFPRGLCDEIEKLMNSFWWGCENSRSGIRWSTWADLCRPKVFGGMGFRRVREMNIAMLGKQGWKFLYEPDALVSRVFKARYFPRCSFLEANSGSNPSFVWSNIRETQGLVREGVRWRIGDGERVRVWGDPWLPDCDNPFVPTPEPPYLNRSFVKSLFSTDSTSWDGDLVRDIFCPRDSSLILSLPTFALPMQDSLFWKGEENGVYSALCNMKLPTKDALVIKQVRCDPLCPLCGNEAETAIHIFANCSFAHECWRILGHDWGLGFVDSIQSWVGEMWMVLSREMCERVVVVCWAIWENRNDMVWNNHSRDPASLLRYAFGFVENWKAVSDKCKGLRSKGSTNVRPYDLNLERKLRREKKVLRDWLREFQDFEVDMEAGDSSNTRQPAHTGANAQHPRQRETVGDNSGARADPQIPNVQDQAQNYMADPNPNINVGGGLGAQFMQQQPMYQQPGYGVPQAEPMAAHLAPEFTEEDCIVYPGIEANNFELKTQLIQMVQNNQFGGSRVEDPKTHIVHFDRICQTIKMNGVPSELHKAFMQEYCPPSKAAKLKKQIQNFQQFGNEDLPEAWTRFKELRRQCPKNLMTPGDFMSSFYEGLSNRSKIILDTSSFGGVFIDMGPAAGEQLIERIISNNTYWYTEGDDIPKREKAAGMFEVGEKMAMQAQLGRSHGLRKQKNGFRLGGS